MRQVERKKAARARRVKREQGGVSSFVVLALVLLVVVVGVVAWLGGGTHTPLAPLEPKAGSASASPAHADDLAQEPVPESEFVEAHVPDKRVDAHIDPARFQGAGRIHGELAPQGVEVPRDWTLVIEPHPYLQGREFAITRRVEFHAGERAFDERDLPFAGYRLRVEAPGLNSSHGNALIVQGSRSVHVTLGLYPAGFIEGSIVDAQAAPAEGLEVFLEEKSSKLRRMQKVDAVGRYMFRDVVDGEYTLFLGRPEKPLVDPIPIGFRAPSLRVADQKLPPTGTLMLLTTDENGKILPEVEVTGYGNPAGGLATTSDALGRAIIPYLLPGKWRVEAVARDGRRGRQPVMIEAGKAAEIAVSVHH